MSNLKGRVMHYTSTILLGFLVTTGMFSTGCATKKDQPGNTSTNMTEKSDQLPAASPEAGLTDITTLLTKEEAEGIMKMPMKEPELQDTKNNLGQKLYIFKPLVSKVPVKMLTLSLVQDEGIDIKVKAAGQTAKVIYDNTKSLIIENNKKLNGKITPMPGLGEDAFLSGKMLYIIQGNTFLTITLTNISIDEPQAVKAVAEIVLSRL